MLELYCLSTFFVLQLNQKLQTMCVRSTMLPENCSPIVSYIHRDILRKLAHFSVHSTSHVMIIIINNISVPLEIMAVEVERRTLQQILSVYISLSAFFKSFFYITNNHHHTTKLGWALAKI